MPHKNAVFLFSFSAVRISLGLYDNRSVCLTPFIPYLGSFFYICPLTNFDQCLALPLYLLTTYFMDGPLLLINLMAKYQIESQVFVCVSGLRIGFMSILYASHFIHQYLHLTTKSEIPYCISISFDEFLPAPEVQLLYIHFRSPIQSV